MKLIDADKLKKEIHCSYSDDLEILEKIDDQPTAYNVSEVVEMLEDQAKKYKKAAQMLENTGLENHSRRMYAKAYSYEDAAKIVKRGWKR